MNRVAWRGERAMASWACRQVNERCTSGRHRPRIEGKGEKQPWPGQVQEDQQDLKGTGERQKKEGAVVESSTECRVMVWWGHIWIGSQSRKSQAVSGQAGKRALALQPPYFPLPYLGCYEHPVRVPAFEPGSAISTPRHRSCPGKGHQIPSTISQGPPCHDRNTTIDFLMLPSRQGFHQVARGVNMIIPSKAAR